MLGIAHHPSTPIVSKGSLCLGAVVLALFGVLVFSASARAHGPGSVSEALTPTETPEGAVPAPPEATETPEAVPGVLPLEVLPPVPNPEVGPESAPALPPPEAVPTTPAPEPGAEPVPAVPAPEPGPVPVPATPAPEAAPAGPAPEVTPETPPVGTGREPAPEAPATGAGKEGAAEGSGAPVAGAAQDGAGPGHGAPGVAPEVSSGLAALQTSAPTGGAGETAAASAPARASGGVKGIVVARPAGDLTCELSALQGRVGPNCSGGLIGFQRSVVSASPVAFVAGAAASLTANDPGGPPDGGHGGSAVLRLPVSPAPGPAPSGVSGGSATGATGLALTGFLTLSGLLLLAAPRALRRLRLSSAPWRTACFVLIPERPG
jgi:hypothetical protein